MNNDHRDHFTSPAGARRERDDGGRNAKPATAPAVAGADEAYFQGHFREMAYYSSGRNWDDYAPAYRFGYALHAAHRGRRFEDVESAIADEWEASKGSSRLTWAEARGAVGDAWRQLDEASPGRSGRRLRIGH